MEKLQICRICLVENVRMYIVNDKDLQELYETLTDIPFVTEDRRPMLACVFCFAKLKQCCQLQRKCLEAEKLFAQMLNEPSTSVNPAQLKSFSGVVVTPVDDIGTIERIAVKEELPDVCERLDDVVEPKVEHFEYELELEPLNNRYNNAEHVPAQPSEPGLEYDVPLVEIKTEVEEEQEVPRKKRRVSDTTQLELENVNRSYSEDIPAQQFQPEAEKFVPLVEIKIEVEEEQEVPTKKRRASDATRADVANKKLRIQGNELENVTTESQKKNKPDAGIIQNAINTQEPQDNICIFDTTLDPSGRAHAGEKPFKCVYCESCFSQKNLLTRHMRTHTGERPYKCEQCQHCFSQKHQLTLHIRTHTGEKPYKCEQCGLCFSHKTTLTCHIRTHTGEKPYKCEVCQLCFGRKSDLTRHIRTHTGEKPYKCQECELCFSQNSQLISHMRTHTGVKPYKCEECQSCFSVKSHLTTHMRKHTGEKPYKCEICQLCFSQSGSLVSHMRTHTGEKPYKCEECQRCFSVKSHLIDHTRTHTGERPYKCEVCHSCFSVKSHLTSHLRKHTGESPYKCEECQRCFSMKSHLTDHMRTHTGEKPYKCGECQLCFAYRATLKSHMRTHTGEKP
ncbi:hypothetical protein PYW08_012403 [Mythimna loreyi]|uniref:Uncharacterized protein n=1 Tax=Mythimna loreyi TaxID=667449 RepID=A0ACC2Q2U8_9NEOP|nr:hypothetical protein PYW08_012403 [Mythimna loreyi]